MSKNLKVLMASVALSAVASSAFATCGTKGYPACPAPSPAPTPAPAPAPAQNVKQDQGQDQTQGQGQLQGQGQGQGQGQQQGQVANGTGVGTGIGTGVGTGTGTGIAKAETGPVSAEGGKGVAKAETGPVTVTPTTNIENKSKTTIFSAGNLPGVAGSAISGPAVVALCQTSSQKDKGGYSVGLGGATSSGAAINFGFSKKGETTSEVKPDMNCVESFQQFEAGQAREQRAHEQAMSALNRSADLDRSMMQAGPAGMAVVLEKNYKEVIKTAADPTSDVSKLMRMYAAPAQTPTPKPAPNAATKSKTKVDPCLVRKTVNICTPNK